MNDTETDLVRRRAQRLSALLRDTDPPVPPIAFPAERIARAARRGSVVRWRAAAAVALLVVGAAGVRPVRAWIAQAARALWSVASGAPRAGSARPARGVASSGTVTFTPPLSLFALRVAQPQAGGTLTIETAAGASASAMVAGGRGSAELVVLPDGLRIVNDPTSSASFVVRLPATLARIEVSVGREAPRIFVPSGAGQRWVVDLRSIR